MQKFLFAVAATICTLALPASAQQQAQRAPLDWFVGYEQFRGAQISPDGQRIAVIRHDSVGDTLMIVDLETRTSRAIQTARADQQMEIAWVDFKSDDRVIFGVTQKIHVVDDRRSVHRNVHVDDAYEFVYRVYASSLDGNDRIALYDPSAGQGFPRWLNAEIISDLPHDPDNVLMIVPDWNAARLWRVNIRTGDHTEIEQGAAWTVGWVVDAQGTPVLREDAISSGKGFAWLRRGPGQHTWTEVARYRGEDAANGAPTFTGVGPALQPGQVFVLARRDGDDTSGLYVFDTATGQYAETIQRNTEFDVSSATLDRENNVVLAACWWGLRRVCEPKDAAFGRHWRAITQALGDDVTVSLSGRGGEGGSRWLIYTESPQDLGTYALYDSTTHNLNTLFSVRATNPSLLPTERIVEYTASDGMHLWGYLWVPPGVTDVRNLPVIVTPHGGPEARDVWGHSIFGQTFASQGYVVFEPNFRGGGGFGRSFVEAGHHQWGRRMQEDVADGVRSLIDTGIADPNRICIMGWSHGGYMAFTASFMNTDLFKCAVAGAGISDLNAMLRWERAGSNEADVGAGGGWGQNSISYQYWTQAIGQEGSELNRYSAAENVDRVTIPLLMIHGDEDQTVPFEQSEIMERAMRRAGKSARLVRLEAMDHYYRPDNEAGWRTAFTEALAFFNANIGPGVPPGGGTAAPTQH
ncbi:MAG: S9 family peptidase [Hyphomonadaceae bacterium]|nr:S9 family peptidase [Hyphomonadaceae bacterium]